jgi:hypothetical protein
MRPTILFTKSTILPDILLLAIKPPERTKKGIAIKVKEFKVVKITGIAKSVPRSNTFIIPIQATAKQAKSGNPLIIKIIIKIMKRRIMAKSLT